MLSLDSQPADLQFCDLLISKRHQEVCDISYDKHDTLVRTVTTKQVKQNKLTFLGDGAAIQLARLENHTGPIDVISHALYMQHGKKSMQRTAGPHLRYTLCWHMLLGNDSQLHNRNGIFMHILTSL